MVNDSCAAHSSDDNSQSSSIVALDEKKCPECLSFVEGHLFEDHLYAHTLDALQSRHLNYGSGSSQSNCNGASTLSQGDSGGIVRGTTLRPSQGDSRGIVSGTTLRRSQGGRLNSASTMRSTHISTGHSSHRYMRSTISSTNHSHQINHLHNELRSREPICPSSGLVIPTWGYYSSVDTSRYPSYCRHSSYNDIFSPSEPTNSHVNQSHHPVISNTTNDLPLHQPLHLSEPMHNDHQQQLSAPIYLSVNEMVHQSEPISDNYPSLRRSDSIVVDDDQPLHQSEPMHDDDQPLHPSVSIAVDLEETPYQQEPSNDIEIPSDMEDSPLEGVATQNSHRHGQTRHRVRTDGFNEQASGITRRPHPIASLYASLETTPPWQNPILQSLESQGEMMSEILREYSNSEMTHDDTAAFENSLRRPIPQSTNRPDYFLPPNVSYLRSQRTGSRSQIDRLRTSLYTPNEGTYSTSNECAICLRIYKVSDKLRHLPCSHAFHKGCVDKWLLRCMRCPVCKCECG